MSEKQLGDQQLLDCKQVSRVLKVSEELLRKLAREKKIPSYRLSPRVLRFDLGEVRKFMRDGR